MSESLVVPEEHLADVIRVLRAGLYSTKVPRIVRKNLLAWCEEMEDYLKRCAE